MQENNNTHHGLIEGRKKTLEEMWKFIEDVLSPYDLVPKRDSMTNDQILTLYSELSEADELFRQLAQIAILKKEIDKSKANWI
jgi:hypothetical protein